MLVYFGWLALEPFSGVHLDPGGPKRVVLPNKYSWIESPYEHLGQNGQQKTGNVSYFENGSRIKVATLHVAFYLVRTHKMDQSNFVCGIV